MWGGYNNGELGNIYPSLGPVYLGLVSPASRVESHDWWFGYGLE